MKLNWLYIGIGAVVVYLIWKKFGQKNGQTSTGGLSVVTTDVPAITNPEVVRSDMTQGDIVNELAFASGSYGIMRKPKYPCYCNGHFAGYMTHADCVEKCTVSKRQAYTIHRPSRVTVSRR